MPLNRTFLFAPGNHPRRVEKALGLDADAVILDLEDAVAVSDKEAARKPVAEALRRPRRGRGYVRVNAPATPYCYRDLVETLHAQVDGVFLPKVESAADLHAVDWLMAALERERGIAEGSIDLVPMVETAAGVARVDRILQARSLRPYPGAWRVKRVAFGAADFSLEAGLAPSLEEPELASARDRVVLASRAADSRGACACTRTRCRSPTPPSRRAPKTWRARSASLPPSRRSRPRAVPRWKSTGRWSTTRSSTARRRCSRPCARSPPRAAETLLPGIALPLAVTLAVQTLVACAIYSAPVMAPVATRELGVSPAAVGYYIAIAYAGSMLGSAGAGGWVARFGPIRVSQVALALCLAGLALAASAWGPLVLLGAFVCGLGYGPTNPASAVILVRAAPPSMFSLVFSIKQTGVPGGGVLAGALVPVLVLAIGWQGAALAIGAACLALAVLIAPVRARYDVGLVRDAPVSPRTVLDTVALVMRHARLREMCATPVSGARPPRVASGARAREDRSGQWRMLVTLRHG
jgi:2-keto-3-deoxy-L-rhamnonate aldolase RhmA